MEIEIIKTSLLSDTNSHLEVLVDWELNTMSGPLAFSSGEDLIHQDISRY